MNHYILTGKKSVSIAKGVTKEGIESEKLPISGEISQYEEKPNSDKGKVFNDLTDYLNFLYLNQKEYADSDEDYDYFYTDQYLQGVSFEILLFQMTVALNWWDSDP